MNSPRWKREQKERHRQKIGSLVRLSAILLIFTLVVLGGSSIFKLARSSKLPKEGRTTIVLSASPVLVVSFEPQGELTLLAIPENTYVEVTRGFGSYRIGAVFGLGEQEKLGGELLAQTTEEFLGVPIDGWVGMENGKLGKEEILALKNNLTSWKIFLRPEELLKNLRKLQTNLTIFDLARVWLRIKATRFDKIQFLDLGQTTSVSPLALADGSLALAADQASLDVACQGLFKDTRLSNEHILIEVLNGTDKAGLANRVSRLITNFGGTVVSVSNSPQKSGMCQIRGETGVLKSFTAGRLGQIFKCAVSFEKPQDSRADLQVIVGTDYWQKLYQR